MNTFRDTQQAKEKGITDQGKNEAVYAFSLIEFFPCLCIISVVISWAKAASSHQLKITEEEEINR